MSLRYLIPICLAVACSSRGRTSATNLTIVGPGGSLKHTFESDEGRSWSYVVQPDDVVIEIDGTTRVILVGYRAQRELRYWVRSEDPPHFVLQAADRPRIEWEDKTLRVGNEFHALDEPGVYSVAPNGELRYRQR